jgi:hypothetical protein
MSDQRHGDLMADLMRRIEEVARPALHVFDLFKSIYEERERLTASYTYVAHSPEHVSSVLQESIMESSRIAEAEGRTGMVRELVGAFLDAAERARREEAWGDIYAADAEETDDSFAEASAIEAGSRWKQTG